MPKKTKHFIYISCYLIHICSQSQRKVLADSYIFKLKGVTCTFDLVFHPQGLLEERALLLGRMGKHEQALFIYVHILNDTRMAEE